MRLRVAEAARRAGGRVEGDPELVLVGAEVDSRLLRPGMLFVALPGAHRDGHEFVAGALATGCAALVRDDATVPAPQAGQALIRVPDPLRAYHALAAAERAERGWTVAAVTGSVGKTTTKDFLAHLAATRHRVGASEGNRNSTLGLPAQMLSQAGEIDLFVAEAGMSRPGELDELGAMLRPQVLLYTRIAPVHTEFFPDLDGIAQAKAELLRHLDSEGCLVVNAGDRHQDDFPRRTRARTLRYGGTHADARIEEIEDRGLLGSRFRLVLGYDSATVELALPGAHQRENLLAAATAGMALGLSAADVAAAAGGLRAARHRGRVHRLGGGVTLVDDSYNASPVAVARLLELLKAAPGRRVAVLGEMYELGELELEAHREAGDRAAASCDVLVAVGGAAAATLAEAARRAGLPAAAVHLAADAGAAAELLGTLLEPGDVVLVKGSRGVGLDRTVTALTGEEAA